MQKRKRREKKKKKKRRRPCAAPRSFNTSDPAALRLGVRKVGEKGGEKKEGRRGRRRSACLASLSSKWQGGEKKGPKGGGKKREREKEAPSVPFLVLTRR